MDSKIFGRLHLDEVITSLPEFGSNTFDNSFSWITLIGIMIIEMTIPNVFSMYGVVLGNILVNKNKNELNLLNEQMALTPILLVVFRNISDPWTDKIVKLASVPRLTALIGIALLSFGVLASGYLASGGVGAYFVSSSAAIVMGMGTSLILAQSDHILHHQFRSKLFLTTTLKNVVFSLSFILTPIFTLTLIEQYDIQTVYLMMAIAFIPIVVAALLLQTTSSRQYVSPYILLNNEQDNELLTRDHSHNVTATENFDSSIHANNEENVAFAYDEDNSDNDNFHFFSKLNHQISSYNEITVFKHYRFWMSIVVWVGIKAAELFFWTLIPSLAIMHGVPSVSLRSAVALFIIAGISCFTVIITSYWKLKTHSQSLLFTCSVLVNAVVFIGYSHQYLTYTWLAVLAFFGGVSMGGLITSQEYALQCIMNKSHVGNKGQIISSTIIGVSILLLIVITPNPITCLQVISGIQLLTGICFSPLLILLLLKRSIT